MSAIPAQGSLVSCIMPTSGRRGLVPAAIRYFLRQEYANRELIVIDDGPDAIADLVPPDPRIRYVRLEATHALGAKRNLACQEAHGEFIVHWDDDDWMAGWRLDYQVASLLRTEADICGLATVLYYDAIYRRSWQYVYPKDSRPWALGGTLCYTKAFWTTNPFPETDIGEDNRFLWSTLPKSIVALEDPTFYVGLIHGSNTSPKHPRPPLWYPYPTETIRNLMGRDWPFYSALAGDRNR